MKRACRSSQNWTIIGEGPNAVFVKRYAREVDMEFEKGQQLHDIGLASGLFASPRPLDLARHGRCIVWQHLPGLVPLRKFLGDRNRPLPSRRDMLFHCGAALATIQSKLQLPEPANEWNPSIPLPPVEQDERCGSAANRSSVHGDFTCVNLFIRRQATDDNQLVIVDASPNAYLFEGCSTTIRVPVYVEPALFIKSLYSRRDFCHAMRGELEPLTQVFLTGYERFAPSPLADHVVYACAASIMRVYATYRRHDGTERAWRGWLAYRHRMTQSRRLEMLSQNSAVRATQSTATT